MNAAGNGGAKMNMHNVCFCILMAMFDEYISWNYEGFRVNHMKAF